MLGQPEALDREGVIEYVLSCWDDETGMLVISTSRKVYINDIGQVPLDPILVMMATSWPRFRESKFCSWKTLLIGRILSVSILVCLYFFSRSLFLSSGTVLLKLVNPDGSVSGDKWGESDTRFSYILLSCLSLLGRLSSLTDEQIEGITENIRKCMNFDGGFGLSPGTESHSGQVWVCTAALTILDRLDIVDRDLLGAWLSERQLPNGGLNGRPEKLEDVSRTILPTKH